MKFGLGKLMLSLLMVLNFFCAIALGDVCRTDIRAEDKSDVRTVVLAGGNAWELFQNYVRELERAGIKPNLRKVKVYTITGTTTKEFSLSWRDILTGQGLKERWENILKKIHSDVDESILAKAIAQKWDIVCVPQTPSVPEKREVKESKGQGGPPVEAKLNLQQGINYMRAKDWENAIKEFTVATQKYPQYDTAYLNRAVAYMHLKKFNKAMDDLDKAVEINPNNPTTHYNFVVLYSLLDQLDRALDSLDRALELGFNNYDALRKDPDLENVRKHPEFRKILEKHKVFLK